MCLLTRYLPRWDFWRAYPARWLLTRHLPRWDFWPGISPARWLLTIISYMNLITPLSRRRIPGSLRSSRLPLGHGASKQCWILRVTGEETFVSLKSEFQSRKRTSSYEFTALTSTTTTRPSSYRPMYTIFRLFKVETTIEGLKCVIRLTFTRWYCSCMKSTYILYDPCIISGLTL